MTPGVAEVLASPQRLAVVDRIGVLPRPAMDRLARLAASVMRTPVGIVTIVGAEEQSFAGAVGLVEGWRGMPVDQGFCPHVVGSGRPLLVPDTALSPFAAEPVVTEVGVRAYAGVPLPIDHEVVGTVCALDTKVRPWTEQDLQAITDVAAAAVAEVRTRLLAAERACMGEAFADAPCLVAVTTGPSHRLTYTNHAFRQFLSPDPRPAALLPHSALPSRPASGAARGHPVSFGALVPGPDAARIRAALDAAYHDATSATVTARLPEPAGRRTHTVTFTIAPRRAPAGSGVDGVVIVGVDTTPQAQAANRVRSLTRLLHTGLAPTGGPGTQDIVETAAPRRAPIAPLRRRTDDRRTAAEDPPTEPLPTSGAFTDVIALSPGRVALVAAEIPGPGVVSAALAGHLRTAVHALATRDLDPAQVITGLDTLVTASPHLRQAAAIYAVLDSATHTLSWASAGCPPPIVPTAHRFHPDHPQGGPPSPGGLLGVRQPDPYVTHHAALTPGTTVALTTPGSPATTPPGDRIGTITAHLDEPAPTLTATAAQIAAFHPDGALLLARLPVTPAHEVTTLALPNNPASAATARHHLTHTLTAWDIHPDVIDSAELIVSELVANSCAHTPRTDQPLHLHLHRSPQSIGIELIDQHPAPPRPRAPHHLDEHGRGLHLIHRLTSRWGHRLHHDHGTPGKAVWTELPIGPTDPVDNHAHPDEGPA